MNIPVEALDAVAAERYATLNKPDSWSEDYAHAPVEVKHQLREMVLDLLTPALPALYAAWEKEHKASQGVLEVPDDLSGLLGDNN